MMATASRRRSLRLGNARGQSIIEFALLMPFALVMALGVVELGYALLDQHVVTKLAREGSNLISRDVAMQQAATAIATMSTSPVDFPAGRAKLIFSVVRRGQTSGTANYNQMVLYQRYEYGSYPGTSRLRTAGPASFGGPPDYAAPNSDNNTGLRVTNLPTSLATVPGGMVYITEIYAAHDLITPFNTFGFLVPSTLYSIAYF